MDTDIDLSPVWLLTAHRSGGTVLARIINCHPGIVIWGEHGGWINKFAEIDAIVSKFPNLNIPIGDRRLDAYSAHGEKAMETFSPWTTRFTRESFRVWARDFIRTTFATDLPPMSRWGFKEIRYHSLTTARFLADLFPSSRFIILRRNLEELLVSNVMAPWSLDRLAQDRNELHAIAYDCAYALSVIDRGLQEIASALPHRCLVVDHSSLKTPSASDAVLAMFSFLGLAVDQKLEEKCMRVLSVKGAGATDWKLASAVIPRDAVQAIAPSALQEAHKLLDRYGVDGARLRRLGSIGRYSFLAGDHDLVGTPYSSMF